MSPQTKNSKRRPHDILTREEADRLVIEALDTDIDEPEPFVRILLILHDHEQEPNLKEAIYLLMKAAYAGSIVHSIDFQEYLEAIRKGRDIVKEACTRWYGGQASGV